MQPDQHLSLSTPLAYQDETAEKDVKPKDTMKLAELCVPEFVACGTANS
jgi:hypothetical protein